MLVSMLGAGKDPLLRDAAASPARPRVSGLAFNPLKAASLRAQEILRRQNSHAAANTTPKLEISRPVLIDTSLDEGRFSSLRRLSSLHTLVEVAEERPSTPIKETVAVAESEKALPSLPSDPVDNRRVSIAPSSVYSQDTPPRPARPSLEHLTSASLTAVPSFDFFASLQDEFPSDDSEDEMSRAWQPASDGQQSSIPRPQRDIKTGVSVRGMAAMLNSGKGPGDDKKSEGPSRPPSRSSSIRSRNWDEIFSKRATEKRDSLIGDGIRSPSVASNRSGAATPVENNTMGKALDESKTPVEPWRGFSGRSAVVPPLIDEEKEKASAVFIPPKSARRPSASKEEIAAVVKKPQEPAKAPATAPSSGAKDEAVFVPPRSNRRPSPPPLNLPAEPKRSIVTRVPPREASIDTDEVKPVPPLKVGGRKTPPKQATSPTTPQAFSKSALSPLMSPFTPTESHAAAAYPSPVSGDPAVSRFSNINTAKEVKMTSILHSGGNSDGSPKPALVRVTSQRASSSQARLNETLSRDDSAEKPAPLRVSSRQDILADKTLPKAPIEKATVQAKEIKPLAAPAPIPAQTEAQAQAQNPAPLAPADAAAPAAATVQNPPHLRAPPPSNSVATVPMAVNPVEPKAEPAPVEAKPSVETKPAPVEAKPVPMETKPAPAEAKPSPVEAKPAPEAKPSPVEAKPASPEAKPAQAIVTAVPKADAPAVVRKEAPTIASTSLPIKDSLLPDGPKTPVRRAPARDILLEYDDSDYSPSPSLQSQQLPSRFSPSTYAPTIKSNYSSPPPTPPQQQAPQQRTSTFMSSNFSTPIPILDRSRQTFSGLPKGPSAGITKTAQSQAQQAPNQALTSNPLSAPKPIQRKPSPAEAVSSQAPSSPPASPGDDVDSKPATPSKLRLLPMPFPDGRPYSPPSPQQRPQSRDLIPRLEAEQAMLQLKKRSVEKEITELSRVLPPNPSTHNIMARSEMNAKREELKMELAGILRDEHEVGLKLYRAWRRRDKSSIYGGPTTLWVRRVGEGF